MNDTRRCEMGDRSNVGRVFAEMSADDFFRAAVASMTMVLDEACEGARKTAATEAVQMSLWWCTAKMLQEVRDELRMLRRAPEKRESAHAGEQ